jgi:hypothetical protein
LYKRQEVSQWLLAVSFTILRAVEGTNNLLSSQSRKSEQFSSLHNAVIHYCAIETNFCFARLLILLENNQDRWLALWAGAEERATGIGHKRKIHRLVWN